MLVLLVEWYYKSMLNFLTFGKFDVEVFFFLGVFGVLYAKNLAFSTYDANTLKKTNTHKRVRMKF